MNQSSAPSLGTSEWIASACAKVPPLWPLDSFVAVNPFVGLTGMKFLEANELISRTRHTEILLPGRYFSERCAAGEILEADFDEAQVFLNKTLSEDEAALVGTWRFQDWQRILDLKADEPVRQNGLMTFAEYCDRKFETNWSNFIIDEISKWCSSYYDQGQSIWKFPQQQQSLLNAFRTVALADLNPEVMGLKGFRRVLKELPVEAERLIAEALQLLKVPTSKAEEFLLRELMTIGGWSSYVQHVVHKSALAGQANHSLVELLAVRLCYDVALCAQYAGSEELLAEWVMSISSSAGQPKDSANRLARLVGHQTMEIAYQRQLLGKLGHNRLKPSAKQLRPAIQAVFCIDVRSEALRRHLELQGDDIETIGFAGFFGLPVEHLPAGALVAKAQCPVLLEPKYRAVESAPPGRKNELFHLQNRRTLRHAWDSFRLSAISCFGFVEACGLGTIVSLAKDSLAVAASNHGAKPSKLRLARRSCEPCECEAEAGLESAEQVALVAGMLKNMGLVANYARVVLICGHGSQTQNNPYGSALDCGACGGQAGDVNARLAVQMLNQPKVRAGLADHGFQIPADTVFLAGLHNTTTDEVSLFDLDAVPVSHELEVKRLQECLSRAGRLASSEREMLAGEGKNNPSPSKARNKANDWSQVRPEWGLAGNAAFIAAPRGLTRGQPLDGRVFLHNYNCETDKDNAVLELILTAPVVVASWINLQYYASRVDNATFGSGNKAIHNVVGTLGIWQGNAGDLQGGLPLQSLHNGERWMHEPLRLSVFIRADTGRIDQVLQKHKTLENLFANGWLHLFALEPAGLSAARYLGRGEWDVSQTMSPIEPPALSCAV